MSHFLQLTGWLSRWQEDSSSRVPYFWPRARRMPGKQIWGGPSVWPFQFQQFHTGHARKLVSSAALRFSLINPYIILHTASPSSCSPSGAHLPRIHIVMKNAFSYSGGHPLVGLLFIDARPGPVLVQLNIKVIIEVPVQNGWRWREKAPRVSRNHVRATERRRKCSMT